MREMHESMQEMTTRVVNTLRDYDTELLGVKKLETVFFVRLVNF